MFHWLDHFLERRRAKRVFKAIVLLRAFGYRVSTPGKGITLDEAIEVMVHQVTAHAPGPTAYRLVYESLAVAIQMASLGTSVAEQMEDARTFAKQIAVVINKYQERIRELQCKLRAAEKQIGG